MKTYLTRLLMTILLCTIAPLTLTGCPQLAAVLPIVTDIITEILDAERKIDQADAHAQEWFANYPNEALESKWKTSVDRTRASLDVALKTAHGAENLGQADHAAAFQQFAAAWAQLYELGVEIGIIGKEGALGTGPRAGIAIGTPLALSRPHR